MHKFPAPFRLKIFPAAIKNILDFKGRIMRVYQPRDHPYTLNSFIFRHFSSRHFNKITKMLGTSFFFAIFFIIKIVIAITASPALLVLLLFFLLHGLIVLRLPFVKIEWPLNISSEQFCQVHILDYHHNPLLPFLVKLTHLCGNIDNLSIEVAPVDRQIITRT